MVREHELWTAWVAIVDTPVEVGLIAVWTGSHHDGLRAHAREGVGSQGCAVPDDVVWTSGDLAAGDVVLFHRCTVHRTLPNRSAGLRRSVDLRFSPA